MAASQQVQHEPLHRELMFNPGWVADPVPWWFREHIRPELFHDLLKVQIQLERRVMDARIDALEEVAEVLGRMK